MRAAGAKMFSDIVGKNGLKTPKVDQIVLNITTGKEKRAAGPKFFGFSLLKSP